MTRAITITLCLLFAVGCASNRKVEQLEAQVEQLEAQVEAAKVAFEVAGESFQELDRRTRTLPNRVSDLERSAPLNDRDYEFMQDWLLELDYRLLDIEEALSR